MRRNYAAAALLLFSWTAAAREPFRPDRPPRTSPLYLNGPLLGYVFDREAGAAVPVLGMAGASVLGTPLATPSPFRLAAVSPRQDYLLGARRDGFLTLLRFVNRTAATRSLGDAAAVRSLALSPSGDAALLEENSGRVRILTGLPDAVVERSVEPRGTVCGQPPVLAVADGAAAMLMACESELSQVAAGGEVRLLGHLPRVSAIAFLPASQAAVVAGDALYLAEDNGLSPLMGAADGLTEPTALAVTPDGRRAIVVESGKQLLAFDLATRRSQPLACACAPDRLAPLGRGAFQLTGGKPIWVLDLEQSRTIFVPAPHN